MRRLESLAVMNGDKHLPREELIGKIKEFKAKNKEVENGWRSEYGFGKYKDGSLA